MDGIKSSLCLATNVPSVTASCVTLDNCSCIILPSPSMGSYLLILTSMEGGNVLFCMKPNRPFSRTFVSIPAIPELKMLPASLLHFPYPYGSQSEHLSSNTEQLIVSVTPLPGTSPSACPSFPLDEDTPLRSSCLFPSPAVLSRLSPGFFQDRCHR